MQHGVMQREEGHPRDAVAAFYDRSVHEVFAYLHRATAGNRSLAEDLTQEAFVACVHAVRRGEPDALTMAWLIGVARHKLVDHYRRHTREERKLSLVWSKSNEAAPLPFDVTSAVALAALGGLSAEHRLVLVLRYLDDLPVAEVAATIGRSTGATESLLVRARRALSESLEGSRHA
jgi:RNA polymerase sigma-70 factor (ECF subfamily)